MTEGSLQHGALRQTTTRRHKRARHVKATGKHAHAQRCTSLCPKRRSCYPQRALQTNFRAMAASAVGLTAGASSPGLRTPPTASSAATVPVSRNSVTCACAQRSLVWHAVEPDWQPPHLARRQRPPAWPACPCPETLSRARAHAGAWFGMRRSLFWQRRICTPPTASSAATVPVSRNSITCARARRSLVWHAAEPVLATPHLHAAHGLQRARVQELRDLRARTVEPGLAAVG